MKLGLDKTKICSLRLELDLNPSVPPALATSHCTRIIEFAITNTTAECNRKGANIDAGSM